MEIRFKKLIRKGQEKSSAKNPYKKYEVDAGFDFFCTWKKETDKYVEYGTDIAIEIPVGYVGLLFPRSSVRDHDLMLKNSVGVIDASYRGEIKFSFSKSYNELSNEHIHRGQYLIDFKNQLAREPNQYEVGDRVGQIVIMKIPEIDMVEADELSETDRGVGGYGSSGK